MNACTWQPQLVTLHDGRQVMSDSEDWRHECEARTVAGMLTIGERRARLYGKLDDSGKLQDGVLQKRGEAATQRLEHTIKQIWHAR